MAVSTFSPKSRTAPPAQSGDGAPSGTNAENGPATNPKILRSSRQQDMVSPYVVAVVQTKEDAVQQRLAELMEGAGFRTLRDMDGVWAKQADGAPSYEHVEGQMRGVVNYLVQKAGAKDYDVVLTLSATPPACFDAHSA
jgi:hypothetical protein